VVLLKRDTWWNHLYVRSRLESSFAPVPLRDAARDVAVNKCTAIGSTARDIAGGRRREAAFEQVAPTEASPPIPALV